MRAAPLLLVCAASVALSGCVAAVIPVIAAGAMGKSQRDRVRKRHAQTAPHKPVAPPKVIPTVDAGVPVPEPIAPAPPAPILATSAFAQFALDQAARRTAGQPVVSALLAKKVDLVRPQFMLCGAAPLAVMIDLDGDPEVMRSILERLSGDLDLLRHAGLSIIWVSETRTGARDAMLRRIGLVDAGQEADIFAFARSSGDRKQLQRRDAAASLCVVAMLGDRKSDFDELFDYLRSDDAAVTLSKMWEQGWFLIASPSQGAEPRKEENALDPR